jgi:hypothetical protein
MPKQSTKTTTAQETKRIVEHLFAGWIETVNISYFQKNLLVDRNGILPIFHQLYRFDNTRSRRFIRNLKVVSYYVVLKPVYGGEYMVLSINRRGLLRAICPISVTTEIDCVYPDNVRSSFFYMKEADLIIHNPIVQPTLEWIHQVATEPTPEMKILINNYHKTCRKLSEQLEEVYKGEVIDQFRDEELVYVMGSVTSMSNVGEKQRLTRFSCPFPTKFYHSQRRNGQITYLTCAEANDYDPMFCVGDVLRIIRLHTHSRVDFFGKRFIFRGYGGAYTLEHLRICQSKYLSDRLVEQRLKSQLNPKWKKLARLVEQTAAAPKVDMSKVTRNLEQLIIALQ